MNKITKKNRRTLIIFFSIIIVLVVSYAGVEVYNYIKKEQLKKEAKKESDKAFEWANNIYADTIFQESDLGSIRYNYKTIKESEFASNDIKQAALDKIKQSKIRIKSGLRIFDEFDITLLKDKTKYRTMSVDSCLPYYHKPVKTKISGYKNSLNRKADDLHKKYHWNKSICLTIAKGKVSLGMTSAMVISALGRPRDINRTVGEWGVHEQWVYSNQYLYFENGKLTSWQD